jgi:hypothetical protein
MQLATFNRRELLRRLGLSTAMLPFLSGLPHIGRAAQPVGKKQRIVFIFTPNGTVPEEFWPEGDGENFQLKRILQPLEAFKSKMLTLRGLDNKVRGDGDGHMRGMSCLLTGIELFPGNIQGGGESPAGWASGISIDQELKNYFQSQEASKTRFGSLEVGVAVPHRADPWTRWSYAGPNQPVAPLSSPYEVFEKLYGQVKDGEAIRSVLDEVRDDLAQLSRHVSHEEKALLEQHTSFVREMEQDLQNAAAQKLQSPPPELEAGIDLDNDGMPTVTRKQCDLLISSFQNDFARVGNLQFTNSVGGARMKWLGIQENHHGLSHDPDLNKDSKEKLIRINIWFAEQIAYLAKRLADTPEPGGEGSLLDNTTLIWTNELGKGNSHSHEDVPFLLLGGGLGFKTGRALNFKNIAHNRLWLSLAHACGHQIPTFGNKGLSEGGPLVLG